MRRLSDLPDAGRLAYLLSHKGTETIFITINTNIVNITVTIIITTVAVIIIVIIIIFNKNLFAGAVQVAFDSGALEPGEHCLRVVVRDEPGVQSEGGAVGLAIDSFDYLAAFDYLKVPQNRAPEDGPGGHQEL